MSNSSPYQVFWSQEARNNLRNFIEKSSHLESRLQFPGIIQRLDERLRQHPREVGEVCQIRGPIEEYLAVRDFVAITFAVDTKRFLVLVRSCRFLSGHGV